MEKKILFLLLAFVLIAGAIFVSAQLNKEQATQKTEPTIEPAKPTCGAEGCKCGGTCGGTCGAVGCGCGK